MSTVVSPPTVTTLRVPVRPTAVPRNTVYRIRLQAGGDLSEVLHRLTEYDVQVLEIRRCAERSDPVRRATPARSEETDIPAAAPAVGVVVPFPGSGRASERRPAHDPGAGPAG